MNEDERLYTELLSARDDVSSALTAYREALKRRALAEDACGKAGLLDCGNPTCIEDATKRYRCGRWFCSEECHDLIC